MALEVTQTLTSTIKLDGVTNSVSKTLNGNLATGDPNYFNVQTIPTSWTLIVFSAAIIATGAGIITLSNVDPTNYVDIGIDGSTGKQRILAGGTMSFWSAAGVADPSIYAKAHTGSVKLQVQASGPTT